MKHVFLISLFLIVSCDTIKPASNQLILERRSTFIKNKQRFDNCMKKNKYVINFEAKFQKKKTGFSSMFDSAPKLVVKDITSVHFLSGNLAEKESGCLKSVISKLELKVRDSKLSHEYFDVRIIRENNKFDVKLDKADYLGVKCGHFAGHSPAKA